MALHRYIVGQVVQIRVRLSDPSTGDPDDPATQDPVDDATIVVSVYKPDATTVTPALTHVSTGVYTGDVTANAAGIWKYWSVSTGSAAGAGPPDGAGEFLVNAVP